jgi:hypothetical protein
MLLVRVHYSVYLTAVADLMLSGIVWNDEEMPSAVVHRYLLVQYCVFGQGSSPVRNCGTIEVEEFPCRVAFSDLAAEQFSRREPESMLGKPWTEAWLFFYAIDLEQKRWLYGNVSQMSSVG